MIARDYDKRVLVYQVADVPDGYGGNTVTRVVLANSWAKLVNGSTANQRATGLGITGLYEPLLFKVRTRIDVPYNGRDLYLNYMGEDYVIKSITEPDELLREIDIFCTKTLMETVPLIDMNDAFNYTFNFKLS
jgi:hypothetical protein